MIIYKNGDILNATENIIAHQANCIGKMGAGLALAIKRKYPKCHNPYVSICNKLGSNLLGTIQMLEVDSNKYVCNLFGQNEIYGKKPTNYRALESSFNLLYDYAKTNLLTVAIPYKIGCGLGGGDWTIVENIIREIFNDYDIVVYKL